MSENDIQLVDVLCITETHLKKEDEISSKDIWKEKEGSVFRCDRSGMKGGGVAMVISSKYEHREIKIPPSGMEVVVAEIYYPIKTIIVAVYIPPGHKKSSSIDNIRSIIKRIDNSQNEHIVIMGDFNEDLTTIGTHHLCDFLVENGFEQHVKFSTTDYGTLLDHVYTRNIAEVEVDIQDCYYSDHDKTFCFLNKA